DISIFNGRLAEFKELADEAQLKNWLQQNNALPAHLIDHLYSRNWEAIGQNNIACLPVLETEALNRELQQQDLPAFSRIPHWQGRCFETTLLNRQLLHPLISGMHSRYGSSLIVRMLARLLEVALIPGQLKQLLTKITASRFLPAISVANDGIGLAQVQAARGLLIHRLELRQGRVHDYRIIAPTEWNFHPEGVVAQGLKQLQTESPTDLQRQAELYINAVDPCVQYALNLINSRNEIKEHV
ncbi:MAG: nickel-dependent hydrogenase large subunit, partial [Methylobacter sp.]